MAAQLAPEERRQEIARLLVDKQTVTVKEIVARFGVSKMTAHRDLDVLEDRKVLRKVHGGATAQPSSLYESSLQFRLGENAEVKDALARRAVKHVRSGSSILIDDSTTCLALVPLLKNVPHLTVVTNFLSAAGEFTGAGDQDARLVVLGGMYYPNYHSLGGILAEHALRELRVDTCFLSVSAVDLSAGVFHQDAEQARLKACMIEAAAESILLVDRSKFEKRALHRIAGLDAFARIIVDHRVGRDVLRALRRSSIVEATATG